MNSENANSQNIEDFIRRWKDSGAAERANYALFLTQLCDLLGVPQPDPTTPDATKNAYVFERDVTFINGDGSTSQGRIDLYKRESFVLEAKQGSDAQDRAAEEAALLAGGQAPRKKKGMAVRGGAEWDDAMIRARGQADRYARALPTSEGWPAFLIVVDVGHTIELYSEFSRTGKTYQHFPDPASFRIHIDDLRKPEIRERLRLVWTDPLSLDPSRRAAKVTRELAERLAELAKLLEKAEHNPADVAKFLMRCLFTMFAEDVDLIPRGSFKGLLESLADEPQNFVPMVAGLWQTMNTGGFSQILRKQVLRFNGGLFADSSALPLTKPMLQLLTQAASADWTDVEPAIFGTLLERALDPVERHKLGAHFTPRAYVERLVLPTIMEPLRDEWRTVYATALQHAREDEFDEARDTVRKFHEQLCETRVLDPACGSGNFLYVALEQMKRLEGEVLNVLHELGDKQKILLEVDPHQFLGIEINPRASAIADLVLWIGYLQWHFRTRGKTALAEPIIKDYRNIENRDAVLAWDSVAEVRDEQGQPVTRWDGRTTKRHPVTGEQVPDDTARVHELQYLNPRKAEWPHADYIVGNPPFIGNKRMRVMLGDGYTECLRQIYPEVPGSAEYVMFWWEKGALLARSNSIRRFGFITTNSIAQTQSGAVLERHIEASDQLSLVFTVPNHPWVDAELGAAVRIAMTVCAPGKQIGTVHEVSREEQGDNETALLEFTIRRGMIAANLKLGADVRNVQPLASNQRLCWQGCKLVGAGFQITDEKRAVFLAQHPDAASRMPAYWAGKDITQNRNERYVVDFYGLTRDVAQRDFSHLFQHIISYVKPERDANRDKTFREVWWQFGRPRPDLRAACRGLRRYVVTSEVAKHRFFIFLEWPENLVDGSVIAIALDDSYFLGVLSSRIHTHWSASAGGRMGVGDDLRYQNGPCYDPFPFPTATDAQQQMIRELGEQLDAHRKRQQSAYPGLTMTGMYNVLEKLRAGEELSDKEKLIHEQGLVSALRQIHDDLDQAVFDAYGWPASLTDEEILERLVALNAARAAEEQQGLIRWLRPEFQNPSANAARQTELTLPDDEQDEPTATKSPKQKKSQTTKPSKAPWPKELAHRTKAIQDALAASTGPVTPQELAKQFQRAHVSQIEKILDSLCTLGLARKTRGRFTR